ncbi:MAG: hypothetical protein GXO84_09510 [Chlorobi bacterium]|nr:hypothetical protein [Chlorobiota bacterium]
MSYRNASQWDEKKEIQCLIIFKKLEAEKFPYGKQMDYCREISKATKLSPGNLSAKVSNYKSVAGINKASNASINTIELYKKYGHLSITKLQNIIGK